MSDVTLCSMVLVGAMASGDLEDLEMSLRDISMDLRLQKPEVQRSFGVDVGLVLSVLAKAAEVVSVVEFGVKVAEAVGAWRRKLRERDLDANCILEHPHRPPLDLRKASDEEILAWFKP
jgi:hypothetical protein